VEANDALNPNSLNYSTDYKMVIACDRAQLRSKATVEQRLSIHPKARTEGQWLTYSFSHMNSGQFGRYAHIVEN
jgi:hypothetical protein